jgi:cytochrome c-type biogenesis protein CcmH
LGEKDPAAGTGTEQVVTKETVLTQLSLIKTARLFLVVLAFAASPAIAKDAQPLADDPQLEERVMAVSRELRCLVCQNETLADSRADLAIDLRNQIREQMKAGKGDKEVIAFVTARYGDFVLYRPPIRPSTYLLWFGPFILLLAGLVLLFRYVRRRRELIVETPLTPDERRRAEVLLQPKSEKTTA